MKKLYTILNSMTLVIALLMTASYGVASGVGTMIVGMFVNRIIVFLAKIIDKLS